MGYSTPKKPFDLGEFLSQKGSVRSGRKPTWQRRAPAVPDEPADVEEDTDAPVAAAAPRKAE
jgi:hypothetical protein